MSAELDEQNRPGLYPRDRLCPVCGHDPYGANKDCPECRGHTIDLRTVDLQTGDLYCPTCRRPHPIEEEAEPSRWFIFADRVLIDLADIKHAYVKYWGLNPDEGQAPDPDGYYTVTVVTTNGMDYTLIKGGSGECVDAFMLLHEKVLAYEPLDPNRLVRMPTRFPPALSN